MAATRDVLGAIRDRITGQRSRPKGASTITQQLARGLFPEAVGFQIGDISLERKIKEAIVAVQIEKRYTKREIFTLYANQMYLGEGAYGVEAAARTYFGKSAKDLTRRRSGDDRRTLPDLAQRADGQHGSREAAPDLRAAADGRRRLHHAEGRGRSQRAADCRSRTPADGGQLDRAVLRRRGPQGSRKPLRRQEALRKRPVGADRPRRQAAGGGKPRARRRASADRQAPRLPEAAPQRHGRKADARHLQAPALGPPDGGRRRRARGRDGG